MLVRQVGNQPPRFGAVYLEHQAGGKPNVSLKNAATECPQRKSYNVVSLDKSIAGKHWVALKLKPCAHRLNPRGLPFS
jgi:hypothetical protein